MRLLALLPLLTACRYEPLGWWNIQTLSASIDGGDTIEVDDAGFVEISSEGGDYATGLLRYKLIPTLDNSLAVYPADELTLLSGNWEMDGAQDFSLFLPIGDAGVTFLTDQTLGRRLTVESADPTIINVPADWTGEEQGSGAVVTATYAMDLIR